MDSDEDVPALSSEAISALQEFMNVSKFHCQNASTNNLLKVNDLQENWQLSQFWYSDNTSLKLANEIDRITPNFGKIALIGCPSLYYFLKNRVADTKEVKLLDIDLRFSCYKEDFVIYDYNNPLPPHLPELLKSSFDVVVLDPPFLSEECLTKCALTAKFLMKSDIIICTGLVMESLVDRLFSAKRVRFKPDHKNNLGNEFACYVNYNSDKLEFQFL